MGWAKFDDGFTDHPKVAAVGAWGELLAMRAVIYAAKQETDGFIPAGQLARLGVGIPAAKKKAVALVEIGLWEETDGGWLIHDFLDFHPSRAEKEEERAKARQRMREVRANKPRSSPYPDPTPPLDDVTTSSNGFAAFNAKRAVDAVRERKRQGLPVKSESGLARTIQAAPEFIEESKRIYAHKECARCRGLGFVEEYAPGAGMHKLACAEVVDD